MFTDGTHKWYNATGIEKMRMDNNGHLAVNSTSVDDTFTFNALSLSGLFIVITRVSSIFFNLRFFMISNMFY